MTRRRCVLAIGLLLATCARVDAQGADSGTRAIALDSVVGVQDFFEDAGAWQTQLIIDTFGTVEAAPRLQLSLRPLVWRMMTGDWEAYIVHASLRYEFQKGPKWRVEAGKFTSPIGLGMTENRASVNDGMVWWHRGYYSPLPSLGAGTAPHALIASIYPVGVMVNTSADHWDARAAFIDRAPTDFFRTVGAPRRGNAIVGAGISPRQGMRIGVATAWGRSGDAIVSEHYSLVNVEGEYAFGYTRVSGEWTHDRFDAPTGDRHANGWTLQARQTLTPRVYVHSRATVMESLMATRVPGVFQDGTYRGVDTTLGYLVNPEMTVRLGHAALRRFNGSAVDHQFGLSMVWAKRWW
jgi:hypothetical protein